MVVGMRCSKALCCLFLCTFDYYTCAYFAVLFTNNDNELDQSMSFRSFFNEREA